MCGRQDLCARVAHNIAQKPPILIKPQDKLYAKSGTKDGDGKKVILQRPHCTGMDKTQISGQNLFRHPYKNFITLLLFVSRMKYVDTWECLPNYTANFILLTKNT
jgi:hypothetical protein